MLFHLFREVHSHLVLRFLLDLIDLEHLHLHAFIHHVEQILMLCEEVNRGRLVIEVLSVVGLGRLSVEESLHLDGQTLLLEEEDAIPGVLWLRREVVYRTIYHGDTHESGFVDHLKIL